MSSKRPVVLMVGPDTQAIGGMGSVAVTLARTAEERGDFDVRLLASGGGKGARGWAAWPGALWSAARTPANLVHLHVASRGSTWRKASFAAVARARRLPYVIHLHGAGYVGFLDSLDSPRLAAARRFYGGAARTITLGQNWRELVMERLGTSPERTLVVANGVQEVPRLQPQKTIVHLGELTRRKGVDVLLEAAAGVLRENPDWRLELVGPTPEPDLVERAETLGRELEGRVVVVGPKHGDEKLPYLGAAGVFVLASRHEGLPMAMLEAMSAGVPVVVTPVGAIEEVITDGANGRLVPPADVEALAAALRELLGDEGLRERLGSSGRATWQERFSGEAMLEGIQSVWSQVLQETGELPPSASGPAEVTVVIPTVGRDSLAGAVASALAQDGDDLTVRVIVVNDSGSPLEHDFDERVQVIDTAGRTGVSAARNRGLEAVTTQWFAFLDDDDRHRPGHLRAAIDTLRANQADIYFCRAQVHQATGSSRVEPAELLAGRSLVDYLTGLSNWRSRSRRVITPTVVAHSRWASHRFDESMRASEDTWWLLTAERSGARVVAGEGVQVDVQADAGRDRSRRAGAPHPLATKLEQSMPEQLPAYLVGRQGRAAARAGDPAEVLRVARRVRQAGGSPRLWPVLGVELAASVAVAVASKVSR